MSWSEIFAISTAILSFVISYFTIRTLWDAQRSQNASNYIDRVLSARASKFSQYGRQWSAHGKVHHHG